MKQEKHEKKKAKLEKKNKKKCCDPVTEPSLIHPGVNQTSMFRYNTLNYPLMTQGLNIDTRAIVLFHPQILAATLIELATRTRQKREEKENVPGQSLKKLKNGDPHE
ncbi:hypothetical protein RUM43_003849 [Polyplax serrata]|uniref:Uncharacterized protein n=1 Tax=Polyplax serrata TaxID=468196 RepID=A0AAN8PAQ5_POLSC